MSTLRVTNVQDTAGANSLTTAQIYNGAAKAWVNFNGTFATSPFTAGNGGIRASFNVSQITDNGLGDYTITFTNALVDANYAVTALQSSFSTSNLGGGMFIRGAQATGATLKSTSQVRMSCFVNTTTLDDYAEVNVAIFR